MFTEQQADLMFLQQMETVIPEKPVDMQENFLEFRRVLFRSVKYNAMMIRKQSPDTLRFLFGSLAC